MTMTQRFGRYGGRYVPETLVAALEELEEAYGRYKDDADFLAELCTLQTDYAGRPTPLFLAQRLSQRVGCTVYLKREDLAHTGAHKINNTLGQILLAVRMGKKRIIAETGAGQHGVATATVAALFGLECHVYMGEEDIRRQELNVFRMRLLGAEVLPVSSGSGTLKDATNEAIRDWVANVEHTHYIIGSVVGPAPYPTLVRDFQAVIGSETRVQLLEKEGRLPDGIVVTFEVTVLSILLALVLGLFTGLGRLSKNKTINLIASTYVEVVRGIPLLVQLFYIYFALGQVFRNLPETNVVFTFLKNMPPLVAAVIAMGVCYGAYMGEVFRAGIDAIDKGQTEAARSLGFNGAQTMFMVILPQAWRTILPPVGNEFIALLKDSSLVSILAVADLLRRGREFASETFFYFEAYTMVALIYLIITLILSKAVSNMENRLNYYARD